MQSIIFGAGSVGRGFIGQLFSESGYDVTFVDVDCGLVDTLNARCSYTLETVSGADREAFTIGPVRAIHAANQDVVTDAVARAALGATAVGAGALPDVAAAFAAGIVRRAETRPGPLNIIVCENLKGAAAHLRSLVRDQLPANLHAYLAETVGFVDTVIGRMAPVPTPAMRAADPSLIRVEPYKKLPVDQTAFVGPIPEIVAMTPEASFPLFTARKLYIHTCGHALLAYAGYLRGHTYGYEALVDPVVRALLDNGLRESVAGIAARFDCDPAWLQEHVDDLMARFGNSALGDTILRLGRDPVRKLGATDRLVGAAKLARDAGLDPVWLAWGIAAALSFDPPDDESAQQLQSLIAHRGVGAALEQVTGVCPHSALGMAVCQRYDRLQTDSEHCFKPPYFHGG